MISFEDVSFTYTNESYVLEDLSVEIPQGQFVCVLGANGSGKSTFLRCLNLLEEPTGGQIVFEGVDITSKETKIDQMRQKIGMVFQQFNLFTNMTVLDNVSAGPVLVKGMKRDEAHKLAQSLLERVGLGDRGGAYPIQLSGGQQQRVAIARALALQPDILCFDEPTSALDPELTGEVLKVIRSLSEQHMTMIIVTHEMAFARDVANRVIFMDGGVIVEQGPARDVIENPQAERTKQFLARYRENQ